MYCSSLDPSPKQSCVRPRFPTTASSSQSPARVQPHIPRPRRTQTDPARRPAPRFVAHRRGPVRAAPPRAPHAASESAPRPRPARAAAALHSAVWRAARPPFRRCFPRVPGIAEKGRCNTVAAAAPAGGFVTPDTQVSTRLWRVLVTDWGCIFMFCAADRIQGSGRHGAPTGCSLLPHVLHQLPGLAGLMAKNICKLGLAQKLLFFWRPNK